MIMLDGDGEDTNFKETLSLCCKADGFLCRKQYQVTLEKYSTGLFLVHNDEQGWGHPPRAVAVKMPICPDPSPGIIPELVIYCFLLVGGIRIATLSTYNQARTKLYFLHTLPYNLPRFLKIT